VSGGGDGIEGRGLDGTVGGSTFSAILAPPDGFYNVYEDKPSKTLMTCWPSTRLETP
jgi:hypothetical protein